MGLPGPSEGSFSPPANRLAQVAEPQGTPYKGVARCMGEWVFAAHTTSADRRV